MHILTYEQLRLQNFALTCERSFDLTKITVGKVGNGLWTAWNCLVLPGTVILKCKNGF